MAEEQSVEINRTDAEVDNAASSVAKKRKSAGTQGTVKFKEAGTSPSSSKARRYSEDEKAEKLGQIESQVADGTTLKEAVKSAGISEQTFYLWKRARSQGPAAQTTSLPTEALTDLVELEAENKRLRGLLAEKLRAENQDLRKRLGLS